MTTVPHPATIRTDQYYRDMRVLIDSITGNNGFANLGWLAPGDNRSYDVAQHEIVRLVTDELNLNTGNRILEIGCGLSGPAKFTAERLKVEVIGIELLRQQIDTGTKIESPVINRFQYIQGSSQALPFYEHCFDGIYCIESAFHYPDKRMFIHEVARVLKPGGRFALAEVVTTQKSNNGWTVSQVKRALSAPNLFTSQQYVNAANAAGLRLIRTLNLTPGVCRSVRQMSHVVRPNWGTLRRAGYARWYLSAIYLIAKLSQIYAKMLPAKYILMTFEKQQ